MLRVFIYIYLIALVVLKVIAKTMLMKINYLRTIMKYNNIINTVHFYGKKYNNR